MLASKAETAWLNIFAIHDFRAMTQTISLWCLTLKPKGRRLDPREPLCITGQRTITQRTMQLWLHTRLFLYLILLILCFELGVQYFLFQQHLSTIPGMAWRLALLSFLSKILVGGASSWLPHHRSNMLREDCFALVVFVFVTVRRRYHKNIPLDFSIKRICLLR